MTITALTPFVAAAGLVLAVGMSTLALGAEEVPAPAAIPATTAAPQPAATTSIVPLYMLGIKAGQKVTIDGHDTKADAAGLPLPIGVPVRLVYSAFAKQESITVISINASTGPMAPTWALDEASVQPDGSVIAVGRGSSRDMFMAESRAMLEARTLAVRAASGLPAVMTGNTSARFSGSCRIMATECVLTVCTDPTSIPPMPRKGGVESRRFSLGGSTGPVTAWVRVTVRVQAAEAAQKPKP